MSIEVGISPMNTEVGISPMSIEVYALEALLRAILPYIIQYTARNMFERTFGERGTDAANAAEPHIGFMLQQLLEAGTGTGVITDPNTGERTTAGNIFSLIDPATGVIIDAPNTTQQPDPEGSGGMITTNPDGTVVDKDNAVTAINARLIQPPQEQRLFLETTIDQFTPTEGLLAIMLSSMYLYFIFNTFKGLFNLRGRF